MKASSMRAYILKIKSQKYFQKALDKRQLFCYNIMRHECWCGSMAEQLICNQQVVGSTPITSSINRGEFPSGQRGQTVNLLSLTSLVRIQLPPPNKNTDLWVGIFIWRGSCRQQRGVAEAVPHTAIAFSS